MFFNLYQQGLWNLFGFWIVVWVKKFIFDIFGNFYKVFAFLFCFLFFSKEDVIILACCFFTVYTIFLMFLFFQYFSPKVLFYNKTLKINAWNFLPIFIFIYFFIAFFLCLILMFFWLPLLWRLSLGVLNSVLFLAVIFFIFLAQSPKKWTKTQFLKIIFKYLSPFLFILFILSLSNLVFTFFPIKFFFFWIFSILYFSKEILFFYKKIWISHIEKSSFLLILFRFSTGIPFFIFESFFTTEIALAGIGISTQSHLATASKSKLFQTAAFSTSPRPYLIIKDKSIANSLNNLIKYTLNQPTQLSSEDMSVLAKSKILSNSELNNLSGAEAAQAVALKKFYDKSVINVDSLFLNECLYVLHPDLSSSKNIKQVAFMFTNSRKHNFSIVLNALDDKNNNTWFLVTKIGLDIVYEKIPASGSLNRLALNESVWKDLSRSDGRLLTKAILIPAHDLVVVKDSSISNVVQSKATSSYDVSKNLGESVQIQLSHLHKPTLDLNLYKDFQQTELLYNRNLKTDSIDTNEVNDFADDRLSFQEKISQDFASLMSVKIQAASILIDDFEKINNLKTKIKYDE